MHIKKHMKRMIIIVVALAIVGSITGYGYFALMESQSVEIPQPIPQKQAAMPEKKLPPVQNTNRQTDPKENVSTAPIQPAAVAIEKQQTPITKIDDSASTLSNPVKIPTSDGKRYFIFGQPKGQNSKTTKKIIFSLPGHGSTAEQDYEAWKPHIKSGSYALASLNWWDGEGEKTSDYYTPREVSLQIKAFLHDHGYAAGDFVVLEGFSRGSANTYPVKAYDIVSGSPVIDAVISASGKYQSDFSLAPEQMKTDKLFSGVPWILACGKKDDNPTRDGCEGMSETRTYLAGQGADVLAVLEDPNGGHGAFHQSPLDLPEKALALLDKLLK